MTAYLDDFPAAELRALIRDVLRDVLPAAIGRDADPLAAPNGRPATPPSGVPAGQPSARLPATGQPATGQPPRSTQPHAGTPAAAEPALSRQVRLETDADLRQFALDILRLADNPARRRDLLSGRLTFTLAGRAQAAAAPDDHRIEKGAVTERAVQRAAKAGQRLVLGPRAVLTPLALVRALALGVPIERER